MIEKDCERTRLLAELKVLQNPPFEISGETQLEVGKRVYEIQTRLGEIIPEQNAGRLYEDNDEGR